MQNPWWRTGQIDPARKKLQPREFLGQIKDLLTSTNLRRAFVLMGMRRVGKTVLMHHLIAKLLDDGVAGKRITYISLSNNLLKGISLYALLELIEEENPEVKKPRYLFIDEIQYYADWQVDLKNLVDFRTDLRILVSGSAAAALKRKSNESGAGRFTSFLLPPLTFYEYLALVKKKQSPLVEQEPNTYRLKDMDRLNQCFIEYVKFGGYPELALLPVYEEQAGSVLTEIVEKVLSDDLPSLYGIDDTEALIDVFTKVTLNAAREVSPMELAQTIGISKLTLKKYLKFLETAFMVRRCNRLHQDGRRLQKDRYFKVYLSNTAMYTALVGPISEQDSQFGFLVETAVFAQRFNERPKLYYARWGSQNYEVDLIELAELRPANALEIKWSDRYARNKQHLEGICKFAKDHKLTQVYISTRSKFDELTIDGVKVLLRPTALLAYHFGIRSIRGLPADLNFRMLAS